jgi:Ankyrin repeats (3 copies)
MAKRTAKKLTLEKWFSSCGGFDPPDIDTLRAGIKAGFLNEQDEYGMTALHLAAADGWLEGVEELLRAGADTETRYYRTGETALLTALQNNHETVVAVLVAGGANPDAGNHFGLTPREWRRLSHPKPFAQIRKKRVQIPEPRIQNAEHLADHHWPHFKIPERDERETLKVGVAVDLYVYGPKRKDKQDTVKVRITARSGRRPNVRYTATVETPLKQTNLPRGMKEVEFGPENVATVYVPRKK